MGVRYLKLQTIAARRADAAGLPGGQDWGDFARREKSMLSKLLGFLQCNGLIETVEKREG
jgi:hypothetical protein